MKTAISIPDKTFEAADELAQELGISRSELYTRAVEDLIRRRKHDQITEAINRVQAELEHDEAEHAFLQNAARRTFERNEW